MEKKKIELYHRRILVTGGLGFIGSNFLNMFVPVMKKTLFINMDAKKHGSNEENIKVRDHENYIQLRDWESEITDIFHIVNVFEKYVPTDIIHFAAETHVDRSIESSATFVKTNVLGTENLLKVFVANNCQVNGKFLHVSTDEVYGDTDRPERQWKETSEMNPRNIYSATKASAEHIVRAYGNVYGFEPCITRAGNNYGPNQDDSKLIPKMIKRALEGKSIKIYGDGTNFRQWTHVEDHCDALGRVLFGRKTGGTWNIAGDDILSNNTVISHILTASGSSSGIVYVDDRQAHDKGYSIDCSKIKQQLLWNPSRDFIAGIYSLIEEYRTKQQKKDVV